MNLSTVSPKSSTFWQNLTLRPYGHQLLTASGSFWLAIACVLMTAVVIIEGVAWGYFGSSMSAQHGLTAGLLVGFIAMVVTWCIDSTLITYDSDKTYYEEKILGKLANEKSSLGSKILAHRLLPLLLRIAFAVGSMAITAPYFAQAIFSTDIAEQIQNERDNEIAQGRERIQQSYLPALQTMQQKIDQLSQQVTDEVSGKQGSGKYGEGVVARSIKSHLINTQHALAAQQIRYEHELAAYDLAIQQGNERLLAKQWQVKLIIDSPKQRELQMDKIKTTSAYHDSKFRIYGSLMLLIAGFLTVKLLPNSGLKIYFSDVLQQEWTRYQQGAFDDWLDAKDKSSNDYVITPNRFEYLMLHFHIREQLSQQERDAREAEFKERQLALQKAREAAQAQADADHAQQQAFEKIHQEGTAGLEKIHQLSEQVAQALTEKAGVQAHLDEVNASIQQLQTDEANYPTRLESQQRLVDKIRQQRARAEKMLADQHATDHTDIKTLELLSKLTEGYLGLDRRYQQQITELNDIQACAQLYQERLLTQQQLAQQLKAQIDGIQQHLDYLEHGKGQIWQRLANCAIDEGLGKNSQLTSKEEV